MRLETVPRDALLIGPLEKAGILRLNMHMNFSTAPEPQGEQKPRVFVMFELIELLDAIVVTLPELLVACHTSLIPSFPHRHKVGQSAPVQESHGPCERHGDTTVTKPRESQGILCTYLDLLGNCRISVKTG